VLYIYDSETVPGMHLGATLYWTILQKFLRKFKLLSLPIELPLTISYPTYYDWPTDVSSLVFTDNRPPELSGALHTIFEEQVPEPEMDQQNVLLVGYIIHPIPEENPLSHRHQLAIRRIWPQFTGFQCGFCCSQRQAALNPRGKHDQHEGTFGREMLEC